MRVLLVVHGFPPAASGGTEAYVHDFSAALAWRGEDEVFVLTRSGDSTRPELGVRRRMSGAVRVVEINNTFQACSSFAESYTNPRLRAIARAEIEAIGPDVAHVQHLTCLSTGILEDLAALHVPVVMTLNDYWLICHRGQLYDRAGGRCSGPFDGGCAGCIPAGMLAGPAAYRAGRLARALPVPGLARSVQFAASTAEAFAPRARIREASVRRLEHMRAAAAYVDRFFAPSATMAEQFVRFDLPEKKLTRCRQGIDLTRFGGLTRTPSSMLRVAFAGSLIPSKAPHVLLDAVDALSPGSVSVDVIGAVATYHGDASYAEAIEGRLGAGYIRRLGPIPHERMPAALNEVDVVVVPSVWIENAPFIIHEAFAAGVPVVASNLGGMAEMVRDGVDGRLFPAGDAVALARILAELAADRGQLERLRAGIVPPMSIADDAARCRALYQALVPAQSATRAEDEASASEPAAVKRLAAIVLNYRTPSETLLAVRSLESSRMPPDAVYVVDNGSEDGSAAALTTALGNDRVIASDTNTGFSAGCNLGIARALSGGAQRILLVNSDAVLAPDAIGVLAAALDRDPTLGIVAPVLMSREEPDRIASAGIAFSPGTARMRHHGAGLPLSLLPPGDVRDVDAVSGCVMLIRREVLERAGLLDPDYFFSFEDIDLCLRARALGYRTACVPGAIAYHEGGRTIGRRSPRRVYFATRNHLRLARRLCPPAHRLTRPVVVVAVNLAYVLISPEVPLLSGLAAVGRGAWHHVRGRYGAF